MTRRLRFVVISLALYALLVSFVLVGSARAFMESDL